MIRGTHLCSAPETRRPLRYYCVAERSEVCQAQALMAVLLLAELGVRNRKPKHLLKATWVLHPELRRSIWIQLLHKVGGGRVGKHWREGKEKIRVIFPKETKVQS